MADHHRSPTNHSECLFSTKFPNALSDSRGRQQSTDIKLGKRSISAVAPGCTDDVHMLDADLDRPAIISRSVTDDGGMTEAEGRRHQSSDGRVGGVACADSAGR